MLSWQPSLEKLEFGNLPDRGSPMISTVTSTISFKPTFLESLVFMRWVDFEGSAFIIKRPLHTIVHLHFSACSSVYYGTTCPSAVVCRGQLHVAWFHYTRKLVLYTVKQHSFGYCYCPLQIFHKIWVPQHLVKLLAVLKWRNMWRLIWSFFFGCWMTAGVQCSAVRLALEVSKSLETSA